MNATGKFKKEIWGYYRKYGREMPWRERQAVRDPYKILVSEVMLQQTQVARVLQKYPEFIRAFPSFRVLARAPLSKVLRVWQGMGYNRRVIALKRIAEIVVRDYKGKLPRDPKVLETFPGIGKATAGALCAFAFNLPVPFIETNIRRVFIHFFFSKRKNVHDEEIFPLVKATLPHQDSRACPPKCSCRREWYYALMDYGAMLGQTNRKQNPNKKSAHYTHQSKFEGSNREMRGKILKLLLKNNPLTLKKISALVPFEEKEIKKNLLTLKKEGFILKTNNKWHCT